MGDAPSECERGRFGLVHAHCLFVVQDLALQIGELDAVMVNDR